MKKGLAAENINTLVNSTNSLQKGYWTIEEQKEFNTLLKLFRDKRITKKKLLQGIKSRTPKQVWSHYSKLKYYFRKKYDNENEKKDDFYLNLIEKIQQEDERSLEHESYVQFCDEMTSSQVKISTGILEYMIKCQSLKNNEMATLKLDENIIKTIVKKKIINDAMLKEIEKETKTLDETDLKKSAVKSINIKTNSSNDQFKSKMSDLWPFMNSSSSSVYETPKHIRYSIFEFSREDSKRNSKSEQMSIRESNSLDFNCFDRSNFAEDQYSDDEYAKKIPDKDQEEINLSDKMKKLLDGEVNISPQHFGV